MDKIAGPYLHTLTGILGDKRSTMLESEIQYKVGITVATGLVGYTFFLSVFLRCDDPTL